MIHTLSRSALIFSLPVLAAAAQRAEATIEHGPYATTIDYGTPTWGKHSLDELPVGGNWRLGNNEATAWRTQAPIVLDNALLAPGEYRVALQRSGEDEFAIAFTSSNLAFGGDGSASLPCKLAKDSPAKKLAIELLRADGKAAPKGAGAANDLSALVRVRFGPHRVEGEFKVAGGRELQSTPKFRLIGWSLPAKLVDERLAAGQAVPIATFLPVAKLRHQDPQAFNVLITAKGAEVVPGLVMPTGSFGFAKVDDPKAEWRQAGEILWSDLTQAAERVEFDGKAERKGKRYELKLRCGKRAAVVKFGEPESKS